MSEKMKSVQKKHRKSLNLKIKSDILNFHNSGMKVHELSKKFNLSQSTVSTILKDKKKYTDEVNKARLMQTTRISKRDSLIPEVENILIVWINDRKSGDDRSRLSQAIISAKAKSIFEALKKKRGGEHKDSSFNASKGWFDRFRRRAGWYNSTPVQPKTSIVEKNSSNSSGTLPENVSDMLDCQVEELDNGLRLKRLTEAFNSIETALRIFKSDDSNFKRSSSVISTIRDAYSCYRKIYSVMQKQVYLEDSGSGGEVEETV